MQHLSLQLIKRPFATVSCKCLSHSSVSSTKACSY
uniref:Uncharacterized protein n=1 Tax=Arundo donax TaxID=35708 RepID=A0A0A9H519_ARUDO